MARLGDGVNDNIRTSTAVAAPVRYSWHLFMKNASAPGTATVAKTLSLADAGATYDLSMCWDHTSSASTYFHRRASGAYDSVAFTGLTSNTWYGLGATYDGANVKLYLNGALHAFVASADPPTSPDPTFCLLAGGAGGFNFDDSTVAEAALWRQALSDEEMRALGRRFSPSLVRPQSLLSYMPLIRETVAYFGPALTVVDTTVAVHPPMIHAQGMNEDRYHAAVVETVFPDMWLVQHPQPQQRPRRQTVQRDWFGLDVFTRPNALSLTLEDAVLMTESGLILSSDYLATGRAQERCN